MTPSHKRPGWCNELQKLVDTYGGIAAKKSKEVSHRTKEMRAQVLFLGFRELSELNCRPDKVTNFRQKHMRALMSKWESDGLSAATLQNRFSTFSIFCAWIGKNAMLGPIEDYLQDPERSERIYAAQRDKSWTGNGVDADAVIKAIAEDDPRVALQLKVLRAFGMRVKEAVMFKPHRSDMGQHVALPRNAGTKGGRPRSFPVDTPIKRAILDEAKAAVPTLDGHISNPNKTLKQNIDRFYNVIRKHGISKANLGVTAHGLRAGYLIDRFKEITGQDAPVRGGTITADKKESVRRAQYVCAEESGHSRYSITTAYYGPIKFVPVVNKDEMPHKASNASCIE